jgi:molybdate transport system permease protein
VTLEVEIEKTFPGFTLQVAFKAEDAPVGILGPSGAGKTMTLRAIAGLDSPGRGRIVLDERVLFDSAARIDLPSRVRRVGLLFQHYALFPHLTVERNIAFGLRHLAGIAAQERARRAAEQVAAMHLSGLERRYPGALSGGQQQRVALARALAPQPAALLLDEPFSALDTHLRGQLERQLRETLASYGGVTLLVSHNLEEIYRLCGHLVVLDKGRVIARGPREEIFRHPPDRMTALLTGCKNFSRARVLNDSTGQRARTGSRFVEALDWGCSLSVSEGIPGIPAHVAIRAHHVSVEFAPAEVSAGVAAGPSAENTFPCWVADSSEAPFRVTLFLRLNGPPATPADYHLQVEINREHWAALKAQPFPWQVQLDPDRLFLLPD